jgi:hypothetical protein
VIDLRSIVLRTEILRSVQDDEVGQPEWVVAGRRGPEHEDDITNGVMRSCGRWTGSPI